MAYALLYRTGEEGDAVHQVSITCQECCRDAVPGLGGREEGKVGSVRKGGRKEAL